MRKCLADEYVQGFGVRRVMDLRLAANSLKTDDPKMTLIDTTYNFQQVNGDRKEDNNKRQKIFWPKRNSTQKL